MKMKALALLLILSAAAVVAQADVTLTQGSLTTRIRSNNGAIYNLKFQGIEYYRKGTYVSDWGLQNGTNTSTFRRNTAPGAVGQSVTVSGSGPLAP